MPKPNDYSVRKILHYPKCIPVKLNTSLLNDFLIVL